MTITSASEGGSYRATTSTTAGHRHVPILENPVRFDAIGVFFLVQNEAELTIMIPALLPQSRLVGPEQFRIINDHAK